jgi:hypothetical protein
MKRVRCGSIIIGNRVCVQVVHAAAFSAAFLSLRVDRPTALRHAPQRAHSRSSHSASDSPIAASLCCRGFQLRTDGLSQFVCRHGGPQRVWLRSSSVFPRCPAVVRRNFLPLFGCDFSDLDLCRLAVRARRPAFLLRPVGDLFGDVSQLARQTLVSCSITAR